MLRLAMLFAVLGLLPQTLLAATSKSPEAGLNTTLHSSIRSYAMEAANLLQALAKFSDDFQVPMGIEWQLSNVPYKPVSLQFNNSSVLKILSDLVAVEPGYKFTVSNGLVHVSKGSLFDDSRNFLNIPISDFELSSEYVFHANNRLRKLVVELAGATPPQKGAGCAGSFGIGAGDEVASFHLRNVVVRDILDKFVTSAGFSIWLATFPELPATTENGFFKSISIFSPNLPDSQLPAWDLLLPGYDPVRKQMGVGWKQGDREKQDPPK